MKEQTQGCVCANVWFLNFIPVLIILSHSMSMCSPNWPQIFSPSFFSFSVLRIEVYATVPAPAFFFYFFNNEFYFLSTFFFIIY